MELVGSPAAAAAPRDRIVFAVGDIHGRRDLLAGVIDELREASRRARAEGKAAVVVFLGDYIDRGPASRGVIEDLIALRDEGCCETVFLRGNHEQAMLDVLDGTSDGRGWLRHGGLALLDSYGAAWSQGAHSQDLQALVRRAVPPEHLAFLRATTLTAREGDYLFVHAGLRPGVDLADQAAEDLMWTRAYDEDPTERAFTVVHGHSPNPVPVQGRRRIAIDTRAYASGALTLLRLEGTGRRFGRISLPPDAAKPGHDVWTSIDAAYGAAARRPASSARDWDDDARAPSRRRRQILAAGIALIALLASGLVIQSREHAADQGAIQAEQPG
jgi:serine/threonine protein phosphatase 1